MTNTSSKRQGRIQDFRKGGQNIVRAQSARAKFLDTPTNELTTPPICRDREAISCFDSKMLYFN